MAPKVAVAVACSSMQYAGWWSKVMALLLQEQKAGIDIDPQVIAVHSALPDHNKNQLVGGTVDWDPPASPEEKRRNELTDANRSTFVHRFLQSEQDWLFSIDDDTVPPKGALTQLLSLGRDFVGGVYFLPRPPHNPIAYMRREDGLYRAIIDYVPGTLTQVDSIGMGCTLIHRSVFERIMDGHTLFQRPNGSLVAVPNERVFDEPDRVDPGPVQQPFIKNGMLQMSAYRPAPEKDNRPWPFFALEYGRTEDHHFCELAGNVGVKPWLDTGVVCDQHFKMQPAGRPQHRGWLAQNADQLRVAPDGTKAA